MLKFTLKIVQLELTALIVAKLPFSGLFAVLSEFS